MDSQVEKRGIYDAQHKSQNSKHLPSHVYLFLLGKDIKKVLAGRKK